MKGVQETEEEKRLGNVSEKTTESDETQQICYSTNRYLDLPPLKAAMPRDQGLPFI